MSLTQHQILRSYLLADILTFTRYFFKVRFKRKFVIGDHHVKIAEALNRVLSGETKRLIINLPPRYSKTELAVKNFIAAGLALNSRAKFIHLSYSDDLVRDNSSEVQSIMRTPEYQSIFRACPTSTNSKKWYTQDGGGLYAVSSSGQVTGFGAGLVSEEKEQRELDGELADLESTISDSEVFGGAIIIDDPIKPDDALSPLIRNKVNNKFETTIRSRVNSRNTPIVIIMQRVGEEDLCGFLLRQEPEDWEVLRLPCIYTDESGEERALWPFKHSLEELKALREKNSFVFDTQYMQDPKPLEGLMYEQGFREYEVIPATGRKLRKNYTDTADEGKDYLCSICYIETEIGNFVTDVLYTQKAMEYTEPKTAEMLTKHDTQLAIIESNNGGRGFARSVERLMRLMGNNKTRVKWFHQGLNKNVRIFSHSAEAQNLTYFPKGWDRLWPEFYRSLTSYMKVGENKFDDACLVAGSMIATVRGNKPIEAIMPGEMVLTPIGPRRVLASGKTGINREVITTCGITGTPDHKVFNDGEFIQLHKCNPHKTNTLTISNLLTWKYKTLLNSMGQHTASWGREGIISASQMTIKNGRGLRDFMLLFGSFITTGEYRKATAFIIRTITLLITTSVTWSAYRLSNTYRIMQKLICRMKNTALNLRRFSIRPERKQVSGIEARRERNGIFSTLKLWLEPTRIWLAGTAEQGLSLFMQIHNSVVINVENSTGASIARSSIQASALFAELSSRPPRSSHPVNTEAHALRPVPIDLIGTADVYNITVEEAGCFYANGILVSNCDALTGTIEYRDKEQAQDLAGLF